MILCLESGSEFGSVALVNENEVIVERVSTKEFSHAKFLASLLDSVLHNINKEEILAVCFAAGPGSYTGLRIGASLAKGICYGLNIPLISISTLELMAHSFIDFDLEKINEDDIIVPMIDARRMEVYTATYNPKLECIQTISAQIINENHKFPIANKIHLLGNGIEKLKNTIHQSNIFFHSDFRFSAAKMHKLALNYFQDKKFSSLNNYEPIYLKEFEVKNSKKFILN